MGTKIGTSDLFDAVGGTKAAVSAGSSPVVEEWRAFTCAGVRAVFEEAARREAGASTSVDPPAPATPRAQRSSRSTRSPRAALPLGQKIPARNSGQAARNNLLRRFQDAATPSRAHGNGGQAEGGSTPHITEPPRAPMRAVGYARGYAGGSVAAGSPPSEAQQRGAADNIQRRAFAARIVARMRAIDAWVHLASGLRASTAGEGDCRELIRARSTA